MSFESCFRKLLLSNTAVAGLVANRVRPVQGAQGTTYPEITYETVTNQSIQSLEGISGLANRRIQVTLWGPDFGQLCTLTEAVRLALQAYRGNVTDDAGNSIYFQHIVYADLRDLPLDQDTQIFQRVMDFECMHNEAQS